MLGLSGHRRRNIALASLLFLLVIFLLLPKLLAPRIHQQLGQAVKLFNQAIVPHGPQHAIEVKEYKQGWFQSTVVLTSADGDWQRVLIIHHGPVAYSKKLSWCLAQAEAESTADHPSIAFFMTFDFHQHFRLWVSDQFDQDAAHWRATRCSMGGYRFTLAAGLPAAGHAMAEPMHFHLKLQDLKGRMPHHQSFLVKQVDWQADVTPFAAGGHPHASHLPPARVVDKKTQDMRVDLSASFQGVQALLDMGGAEHLPVRFDIQQMGWRHLILPSVREWLVFGGQIALQREPDLRQVMRLTNSLLNRKTLITLDGLKAEPTDPLVKGVYKAHGALDGSRLPEDHTIADVMLLLKASLDIEALGIDDQRNQKAVLHLDQFKLHMDRDLAEHDFSIDLKGLRHVVGVHQDALHFGALHVSNHERPAARGLMAVETHVLGDGLCVKKDCLDDFHLNIKGEGVRNDYSESQYPKLKALVGQLLGIAIREVQEQQAVEKRQQLHSDGVAQWRRPNAKAGQVHQRSQADRDRENRRVASIRRALQAKRIQQWRALMDQMNALTYDQHSRYVFDAKAQGTMFDGNFKGFYRPIYLSSSVLQGAAAIGAQHDGAARVPSQSVSRLAHWFQRGLRFEGALTVKPHAVALKQFFKRLVQDHSATVNQQGLYTLLFKVASQGLLLNDKPFTPDAFDKAAAPAKPVLSTPEK